MPMRVAGSAYRYLPALHPDVDWHCTLRWAIHNRLQMNVNFTGPCLPCQRLSNMLVFVTA